MLCHHAPFIAAAARQWTVHLAVALDSPADTRELERRGCVVHSLAVSRSSANPFRVHGEIRALRALVRRIAPDVVDAFTIKCVFAAAMACSGMDVGFMATVVGLGYMFSGDSMKQRILRRLVMRALSRKLPRLRHAVLFSNSDDRETFRRYGLCLEDDPDIVPVPGIDENEFAFLPEDPSAFRVVLPSRMLREKGVAEFVDAARIVRQTHPHIQFLLAGDRDDNPSALTGEELAGWSAEGFIAWMGRIEDMPALLASCHVVCLPSYYREGFPRVLAEAMSCGRAIVTTDVPGCRDVGGVYRCGLVTPPRDAGELARAVVRLHDSPELRRELGARGREMALRHLREEDLTRRVLRILERFKTL